jgi:hypothetical protein
VGAWVTSPFGPFADVMLERPDGHRLLLAPTEEIATYVSTIYTFDEVQVAAVAARREGPTLHVEAAPLDATLTIGRRTALGHLLRAIPRSVATSTTWATAIDPIARRVRTGVRTKGTTTGGTEFYAATDEHAIEAVSATWGSEDLGALTAVQPPVRFGFSSSPPRPAAVQVTTTIHPH